MEGRIYVIGGRIGGSYARNLAVNEVYDPAMDRWRTRAPMPTPRSGIAAAVLDGEILVFGGEATTGTFDQVEGYDERNGRWFKDVRLPLNPELTAIIGNKCSGKSALAFHLVQNTLVGRRKAPVPVLVDEDWG